MEYECLCGDRCELCKNCGLPECECMCLTQDEKDDDFDEDEMEEETDDEWG